MGFGTYRRLQIVILAILAAVPAVASDYWLSYTLRTTNIQISFENITISRAMTEKNGEKPTYSFKLDVYGDYPNEWAFMKSRQQEIVDELLKYKVLVNANTSAFNLASQQSSKIELPPVRIGTRFNQEYATITVYE